MEAVDRFIQQVRGSALGHCPCRLARKVYGKDEGEEGVGDNSAPLLIDPRLTDGHWHEFEVKERLVRMGVVFYSGLAWSVGVRIPIYAELEVLGHIDGEVFVEKGQVKGVKEGEYLLEVKSMAPGSYWKFVKKGYREAFPEYFDQLQGYLHGEVTTASSTVADSSNPVAGLYERMAGYEVHDTHHKFPKMGLVIAKNKETGGLWAEVVPPDDDYFVGLCRRWAEAREIVEKGGLPACIHDPEETHWEKERCGCGREEERAVVRVSAPLVSVDGELLENARIYAAGRRLKDLAEAMIDYAEPSLTLKEEEGRVQVGPVIINQYKQVRASWDHRTVERMLSPEALKRVKKEKEVVVTRRTVGEFSAAEVVEVVDALRVRDGFSRYPLLTAGGTE